MAASPRQLLAASEVPSAPLTVELETVSLPVDRVLRYLPGRRLVGLGQWHGRPVVFKCFAPEPRALREYRHEYACLQGLGERGIAAPGCVEAWREEAGAVLVLDALDGETAAEALTRAVDARARHGLLTELFDWLLEVLRRGCRQTDIHLDNFLRVDGHWHMLDAGACRLRPRVRPGRQRRDLARLVAQFPPEDDAALAPLLRARGFSESGFFRALYRERITRYRRMLAKTERDCTEFARLRLSGAEGMVARRQRDALLERMNGDPDQLLHDAEPLKQGNSATVVLRPEAGWVVKRYNVKSRLHGFKRRWKRSRARTSWRAGHYLRWLGIDTPAPVACIEERGGGRAWLVAEQANGELLDRRVEREPLADEQIAAFERLLRLMYRFRVSHGDMKASNFLVRGEQLILIDLDAVRFHRSGLRARRALRRDLRRLLRNWPEEAADRRRLAAVGDRVLGGG
jgi:tRNA A-37 threonylcarbamoyl transferase component Bud32